MLAQLQLKKPAAGDIWPALSVQRIEWSTANIDNIKIETSLDSGRTWTVLLSSYPASATYYEMTKGYVHADNAVIENGISKIAIEKISLKKVQFIKPQQLTLNN